MALPDIRISRSARSGVTHACEACGLDVWSSVVREQVDELGLVVRPVWAYRPSR